MFDFLNSWKESFELFIGRSERFWKDLAGKLSDLGEEGIVGIWRECVGSVGGEDVVGVGIVEERVACGLRRLVAVAEKSLGKFLCVFAGIFKVRGELLSPEDKIFILSLNP